MTPTQRRAAERAALRERILAEARTQFAADGVERVTMRRIAQAIGYSATTIYLHFPDKVSLLRELCARDCQSLQQAFASAMRGSDPVGRIRAIGMAYVRFAKAHPHHYRLMFMTALADEDARAVSDGSPIERGDPTQDAYALLAGLVADAQAAGRLRRGRGEPHATAQVLWAGLHGVIALHLDKGNDPWVPWRPFEEQAGRMIDALLHGHAAGVR